MVSTTHGKLRWRSDFDKAVLIQNFEKRGWTKANGEGNDVSTTINACTFRLIFNILLILFIDDWNIYWANPWTVKSIFSPENGYRLNENQ